MNLDPHENERAECDAAMAAFLAKGGKIDRLPNGAMAASGWKPEDYDPSNPKTKQRSMRNREIAKEEQAARKRAKAAEPLPRDVKVLPAPKPKSPKSQAAKPPRVPRPDARIRSAEHRRARKGAPMGPEPVKANAVLALLQARGPMTAAAIAHALGDLPATTGQRLWVMRKRGKLESVGSRGNMRWKAKA